DSSSGWRIGSSNKSGIKKSSRMCQLVFIVSSLYQGAEKATDSPQPLVPSVSVTSTKRKSLSRKEPKLVAKGALRRMRSWRRVTRAIFILHPPFRFWKAGRDTVAPFFAEHSSVPASPVHEAFLSRRIPRQREFEKSFSFSDASPGPGPNRGL